MLDISNSIVVIEAVLNVSRTRQALKRAAHVAYDIC